jgi:FKBP-type peptidyl-prolyl cis-trans isomerase SlyD
VHYQHKEKTMNKDTVRNGVVVSMEYTLHVNGELLDTSEEHGPLQFLAGRRNIIPGLENEMMGMKVGDSKEVVVQPADGYGELDEEAFMDASRAEFPPDLKIEAGMELNVTDQNGLQHRARIDSIEGDTVRLNFNHPLAGMELNFNVKVVGLREPTPEEVEHGHVHEGGHHH